MTADHPGQYMVLQFVPDTVRNERLNVGLLVADLTARTLRLEVADRLSRIHRIDPHADLPGLQEYLELLEEQIASLAWSPPADLARLLNLEEHFTFTDPLPAALDPDARTVRSLFDRLVGTGTKRATPAAPTRPQVRKWLRSEFGRRGLTESVSEAAHIRGKRDSYAFDFAHESVRNLWAVEIIVVRPHKLEESLDAARALLFKRMDLEAAAATRRIEIDAVLSSPPGSGLEQKVAGVVEAAGCVPTRTEYAAARLEQMLNVRG